MNTMYFVLVLGIRLLHHGNPYVRYIKYFSRDLHYYFISNLLIMTSDFTDTDKTFYFNAV